MACAQDRPKRVVDAVAFPTRATDALHELGVTSLIFTLQFKPVAPQTRREGQTTANRSRCTGALHTWVVDKCIQPRRVREHHRQRRPDWEKRVISHAAQCSQGNWRTNGTTNVPQSDVAR